MIPTADTPDVFGSSVFCDDIREEVGGKASLIGVYMGGMLVHSPFPAAIPRFGIAISLWQRHAKFVPNVELRIYLPGDDDDKPSIISHAEAGGGTVPEASEENSYLVMRANLTMTNLVLKRAGKIKVRALINGTLIPLGSLPVSLAPAVPAREKTEDVSGA